ncbi:hypothetical protein GCM10025874_16460 [Arenivirga flava]|uniref:HTH tetR-type domain-containing protein n=1 Tax=Arenivirga flava TaxID=1930060 RepID=A0AA37XB62_9MICO|nr:hypothetical protein GCM10025874_16460 [Arenivirga flava]
MSLRPGTSPRRRCDHRIDHGGAPRSRAADQRGRPALPRAQGFAATTVEDIAESAGGSPRTFFRCFATKEDAALFDFIEVDEALGGLELDVKDLADASVEVQRFLAGLLRALEGDRLERFAQIRRLTEAIPSIRHAADARLRTVTRGIRDALIAALGEAADDARQSSSCRSRGTLPQTTEV